MQITRSQSVWAPIQTRFWIDISEPVIGMLITIMLSTLKVFCFRFFSLDKRIYVDEKIFETLLFFDDLFP